jgi:hypothetical protein
MSAFHNSPELIAAVAEWAQGGPEPTAALLESVSADHPRARPRGRGAARGGARAR